MRCCRGHSSPSTHPPPGPKPAHADRTRFVTQATRNFQSLEKHFHVPYPRQACTPWPEGGGRSAALGTVASEVRPPQPARAGTQSQLRPNPGRRAESAIGNQPHRLAAAPVPAPRSRPTSQAPLQPAVTAKPAHPPRPPPPSPAPGRRKASYTTTGGLRLPTRPRAPLERAQKVRLPRSAALALHPS